MLLLLVLEKMEVMVVLVVLEEVVVVVEEIFKKRNLFFQNIHCPANPWLARALGFVAVGERATFYLAQSCLHCYFFLG